VNPSRVNNFLYSMSSRPALGFTQPPIQWVMESLPPGVKWQGREADHSPPASSEVKKMWIYIHPVPETNIPFTFTNKQYFDKLL
jgi:hypothetical protein